MSFDRFYLVHDVVLLIKRYNKVKKPRIIMLLQNQAVFRAHRRILEALVETETVNLYFIESLNLLILYLFVRNITFSESIGTYKIFWRNTKLEPLSTIKRNIVPLSTSKPRVSANLRRTSIRDDAVIYIAMESLSQMELDELCRHVTCLYFDT